MSATVCRAAGAAQPPLMHPADDGAPRETSDECGRPKAASPDAKHRGVVDKLCRRAHGRAVEKPASPAKAPSPPATDAMPLALQPTDLPPEARAIVHVCPWLCNVPFISPTHDLARVADVVATKYRGEFCWASSFEAKFVVRLMAHGFLPMAQRVGRLQSGQAYHVLLPKMHRERCALHFREVHVHRSVRRKAKNFSVSCDTSFDLVVAAISKQHGADCWLYAPLVVAFKAIFDDPFAAAAQGAAKPARAASGRPDRPEPLVRMHTFECWDEHGALVAGELGYACGDIYTSLSGFSDAASAGSVQCAATARCLERSGFSLWDLGMELPYKAAMGARAVPRLDFLDRLKAARNLPHGRGALPLRLPGRTNVRSLLDEPDCDATCDATS
ncbi:acyl-CoA N-acyltransferase [Pelagophyceae sp. CCMP2097]|nr:acyl-CoA N-acyltransferase [Pelagophyceae sp. CCMP2097]